MLVFLDPAGPLVHGGSGLASLPSWPLISFTSCLMFTVGSFSSSLGESALFASLGNNAEGLSLAYSVKML